jgi:DNA-binding NarL/FixJ family response regulator
LVTQTARPVDVLIVDDQESFLDAMAALIGVMSGFRVVGVATSGRQALERVQQQPVDLVLLDVHLGEESGIEIGVAMQALAHRPAVVLMSAYRREELGLDIQLVGAPFIAKDELSPTRLRNTWCVLRSARESDPD